MSFNNNNDSRRTSTSTSVLLIGLLLGATSLAVHFGLQNQSLQVRAENLKAELDQQLDFQDVISVSSASYGEDDFTATEADTTTALAVNSKATREMSRQLIGVDLDGLINDLGTEVDGLSSQTDRFMELTAEYDGILKQVEEFETSPDILTIETKDYLASSHESVRRHNSQLRPGERRLKGGRRFLLGLCGDACDTDSDCGESLVCFHRDRKPWHVPGCNGGAINKRNYCVDKLQVRIVGQNGKPQNNFPLALCEGDCDNDNECAGSLVCFHRDRIMGQNRGTGQNLDVPGCDGGAADLSRTDYCAVDEQDKRTRMPQLVESLATLKIQRRALSSTNSQMKVLNILMTDKAVALIKDKNALQNQKADLDSNQQFLTDKVGELEDDASNFRKQIQELNASNNNLKVELDKTANLNNQLEKNVQEFKEENQILKANNARHQSLNDELKLESLPELKGQIQKLTEANIDLTKLNQKLTSISEGLQESVDGLKIQVDRLEETKIGLGATVGTLKGEIDSLIDSKKGLETDISLLGNENKNLKNNITRLENTNEALTNVASFLNETTNNFGDSLESVTTFLDDQITVYRDSILENIQNNYLFRITNWDCAYRDWFSERDFGKNGKIVILDQYYGEVFEYVGARVMDDLCLDTDDFRYYLSTLHTDGELTGDRLYSAVQAYTTDALDYYFPDGNDDDSGLTKEAWTVAKYDCDNLNMNELYYFR